MLAVLSVKVNSATNTRRSALKDPKRTHIKKNHCCFLHKTLQVEIASYTLKYVPLPQFYKSQTKRKVNLPWLELRARLQTEPWAPNSQLRGLDKMPFQGSFQPTAIYESVNVIHNRTRHLLKDDKKCAHLHDYMNELEVEFYELTKTTTKDC